MIDFTNCASMYVALYIFMFVKSNFPSIGSGSDSKMNRYVTYFPSQGSFDVTCNVTDQVPLWRVNDVTYTINQLNDGILLGHSQSNIANRSILTVNSPTNSTKYVCFITEDNMDILSIPVIVNIAGKI